MLHKARELLVRQQTMLVNAIRGHMAELGMIAPQGSGKIKDLIAVIQDSEDQSIPALARAAAHHEDRVGVRQVHHEKVDLALDAADHADRFAEVGL
jgi:transposase